MRKVFIFPVFLLSFLLLILNVHASWTTQRLTWNTGNSQYPVIKTSGSDVLVAWQDYTPGNWEIFGKGSEDGGTTWETGRLTWNDFASWHPDAGINSSDHIHLFWENYNATQAEIYFKRVIRDIPSVITKRLTWNSGRSIDPAVAIDSNDHIHLVWRDETTGDGDIYYKKSTDNGDSWTTKRLTWNPGSCGSGSPDVAIDSNGHIHVVWQDDVGGSAYEVYHKKSTDGGSSWTAKRLTWTSGDSRCPRLVTGASSQIYLVWYDNTYGDYEIFFKKSTDGGASWTTKRLTWNTGGSRSPAIAMDSMGYIHVVWYDYSPGNSEIFHKKSTDGGSSWTTERLTWTSHDSTWPDLSIDSNDKVHVVWQEDLSGNKEIYYKKQE